MDTFNVVLELLPIPCTKYNAIIIMVGHSKINYIPYSRKIYPGPIFYLDFINCLHFFEVWWHSFDVERFIFERGLFSGEVKSSARTVYISASMHTRNTDRRKIYPLPNPSPYQNPRSLKTKLHNIKRVNVTKL